LRKIPLKQQLTVSFSLPVKWRLLAKRGVRDPESYRGQVLKRTTGQMRQEKTRTTG
jgi:hypothetical protein